MLILRILARGPAHGYGIAQHIKSVSEDVLQVGESSLYPALQRLLLNGWVKAEWGASENNRRARFYSLTPAGRKQLVTEREEFQRIIVAIQKVLENGRSICACCAACRLCFDLDAWMPSFTKRWSSIAR